MNDVVELIKSQVIKLCFFRSFATHTVPRTELIGDPDRYVKAGSNVVLRCVVRGALEPPSYIIWYHGAQQIFTENRRGWRIQVERSPADTDGDSHSTVSVARKKFMIKL